jgi:hypothetical protein
MLNARQSKRPVVKHSNLIKPVLALSCLGLLTMGMVSFTGCKGGGDSSQDEQKKVAPLTMSVAQIDQVSKLGEKVPDGQYVVARVSLKNNSNATIVLEPANFALQNITKNDAERYSQPVEAGLTNEFAKDYGEALKSKVIDYESANLYPRMQIERYFVFMVPSDSAVNGYQITYKPAEISIPLVTPEVTVINDHRTETTPTNDSQSAQPSNP